MCNITTGGTAYIHCTLLSNVSLLSNNNSSYDDNADVVGMAVSASLVVRAIVMSMIITAAILGNTLVIVSVAKFQELRTTAHTFVISLAVSDLLVALLAMPFNAAQVIRGRWMFNVVVCNIFNANDVLFSTASILNLCCISVERYLKISAPFHNRLTNCKVALMLACVWGFSTLISHIPLHTGWYTSEVIRNTGPIQDDICVFEVNKVYAAMSSSISFWIPGFIIVVMYVNTFRLGTRALRGPGGINATIRTELKLAKTLGIIMACFLLCWLPFFLWYVIATFCGHDRCPTPALVEGILFWIGYFNSAMNPAIYAFHNRSFRQAFKRLLCCSQHSFKNCETELAPLK